MQRVLYCGSGPCPQRVFKVGRFACRASSYRSGVVAGAVLWERALPAKGVSAPAGVDRLGAAKVVPLIQVDTHIDTGGGLSGGFHSFCESSDAHIFHQAIE